MRTVFEVRLGAQVIATGTRGTLYFDDFEARRFSYIGTLPDPGLPVPEPPSQPGWDATNYTYDPNHVHAAITAGANTYTYDANGNMTCRVEDGVTYKQIYNSENRLSTVQLVMSGTCASPTTIPSQWDFVYDGDGNRVKQTYTDFTTSPYTVTISSYFMGGLYEVSDGAAVKKYYGIAGMMVAMSDGGVMKYLLTDHLGSVVAIADASGNVLSQQRYLPFGQERADLGPITQTDFGYTGQRNIADIGLMDYNARMYDSLLGRFVQPDSIIPGFADPQSWNRFAYVLNNPINFTDPTGNAYTKPKGCDVDYQGSCSSMLSGQIYKSHHKNNDDGNGGMPSYTYHLHSDNNLYLMGWQNFGSAWSIYSNPHASWLQRMGAGYYMDAWGGAHILLVIGSSVMVIASFTETATTGAVACAADAGECEEAAVKIEDEAVQVVSVIGKYDANEKLAKSIGGNWLNILPDVWNKLSPEEQWERNKIWLDEAIIRHDVFRLASPMSEATGSFGKELNYLFGTGYTISANGQYLYPPAP